MFVLLCFHNTSRISSRSLKFCLVRRLSSFVEVVGRSRSLFVVVRRSRRSFVASHERLCTLLRKQERLCTTAHTRRGCVHSCAHQERLYALLRPLVRSFIAVLRPPVKWFVAVRHSQVVRRSSSFVVRRKSSFASHEWLCTLLRKQERLCTKARTRRGLCTLLVVILLCP